MPSRERRRPQVKKAGDALGNIVEHAKLIGEVLGEFIYGMCGRENRGPARDDRHDGLVVVARREVEVGNLRGKHQLLELVIQCD